MKEYFISLYVSLACESVSLVMLLQENFLSMPKFVSRNLKPNKLTKLILYRNL